MQAGLAVTLPSAFAALVFHRGNVEVAEHAVALLSNVVTNPACLLRIRSAALKPLLLNVQSLHPGNLLIADRVPKLVVRL